jgi:hypothetical protein
MAARFSDMIHEEEDIINLISDSDDGPRVVAVHKGKGKTRDLDLGDVIELSE